ncbi:MAG: oligosaccharide flippase family protein [Sphingomonas taxi]
MTRVGALWHKVLRNPSAMIVANTAAQSVLRLISNIILARLLAPSAFALLALTSLILTGLQMISDVGIAITALREGEMSEENEAKLWSMQIVRGCVVGVLMAAAAVPIGWIYSDAQLRDVVFALALLPVIQGAQSLYPVLALAHRRLLPSTLLEVTGRVFAIVVSVVVALVSPTVWSLVIATLAGAVFTTTGSHMLSGRLPRFVFDRGYIAHQWRFARWIQTSSTLTFVGMQIDKALFPFLFGMSAFGLYGIGATFAAIPAQVTQRWSASVYYPLAVQLLKGDARARAQLIGVRTTMLLYSVIVTLVVMAGSPAFFLLLYEPRYHAAARFAEILAIGTFFEVGETSLRHFPLVEGTPHFEVWTVIVRLAAFGAAVLAVHLLGAGVAGYALAYVVGLAASHMFMLLTCVRRGYLRPGLDLLFALVLAGAAAAIYFMPLPQMSALALIAQAAAVAGVGSIAMLAVYVRRGLPSLPAEPARETLIEAAEDELGTLPKRA